MVLLGCSVIVPLNARIFCEGFIVAASAAVGLRKMLEGLLISTTITVFSVPEASLTHTYFSDSSVSVVNPMAAGFIPNAVNWECEP